MPRRLIRTLRRGLYLVHRWIGIVTCLLFAMWFISGLVMMYVAFPALSEAERLAALPEIAWDQVALAPDQAMQAMGATRYPRELRLSMLADLPVYRMTDWDGRRQTISATDGRAITGVTAAQALAIAAQHPASRTPQLQAMVARDQWSVVARYDPLRPFYLVALGDEAGTRLYVSSRSGEIALDTNSHERIWNWLGSIPHWIYPTLLRQDGALWRTAVLWISGICLVVGISGLWIGILRLRLRLARRRPGGRVTPYRGWMAWHHLSGLVGGVFVLTWMFSGWLSLDPGHLFAERGGMAQLLQRYADHALPTIAARLPAIEGAAVEARFVWIGGEPRMVAAARDGTLTPRDVATGAAAPLPQDHLFMSAVRSQLDGPLAERLTIWKDDAYWHSHRRARELPVLRAVFADPAQTWLHISLLSGEILGRSDAGRRRYRWLYNGLHSFDIPLLLAHRPAWDLVVIALSLLGLMISASGVVIGWRYLRR